MISLYEYDQEKGKAMMSAITPLFKIARKVLGSAIGPKKKKKKKETKGMHSRKKKYRIDKLSLFAYDISTCIENPTGSTKESY